MSVWPPEGSPLAVTSEMEAMMKKMNYPVIKVCGQTPGHTMRARAPRSPRKVQPRGANVAALSPSRQQCDMKEEMRAEVVDAAVGAMEKYSANMEVRPASPRAPRARAPLDGGGNARVSERLSLNRR
jgi:hypothetical protein